MWLADGAVPTNEVEKKFDTTVTGKYIRVRMVKTVTAAASCVFFSASSCILALSLSISSFSLRDSFASSCKANPLLRSKKLETRFVIL